VLGNCTPVGFVASGDLDRSREFYEHVLGLRCVEQDPFACVFDATGMLLRVTSVPDPPELPSTVFGWEVTDLESMIDALRDRGVEFVRFEGMDQRENGIWCAPGGALVAWFRDPDRNVLSLTEPPPR
jgi:catechol 2,3-dioxygenase-like lactoylglutathione lyase family enzyme